MNRGTVMEAGNNKAVVLTPDGQFIRIKVRREVAIGDEISWTAADSVPVWRRSVFRRRRWMSYAISTAALLFLMLGLWSFRTPPVVAYVSMDINPSIEFGLDSHERVRELRAVNQDAAPFLEGMDYQGKPIESVMAILAKKLTDAHILTGGDGEIVIASVRLRSVDTEWEVRVTDKIERVLQQASAGSGDTAIPSSALDIEKLFLPVDVRDEAKANGISSGKMAFWLAAESKGHRVPLSTLQKDSLKKIASSWGGLKQVLGDGQDLKQDQKTWKKLLANQEQKKKQQKEEKPSPTPTPAQPRQSDKPVSSEGKHEKSKPGDKQQGKSREKKKSQDDRIRKPEDNKQSNNQDDKQNDKKKDEQSNNQDDNENNQNDNQNDKQNKQTTPNDNGMTSAKQSHDGSDSHSGEPQGNERHNLQDEHGN
jgi:hypothetical protein